MAPETPMQLSLDGPPQRHVTLELVRTDTGERIQSATGPEVQARADLEKTQHDITFWDVAGKLGKLEIREVTADG